MLLMFLMLDKFECNNSELQGDESVWSFPLIRYNKKAKPKGRGPTLEETQLDHAIRTSIAITKLQLGRNMRKKKKMNNTKEKCDFKKIIFL